MKMRQVFYVEIGEQTYSVLNWLNGNTCQDDNRPTIKAIHIHEGGKILEATNGINLVRVKLEKELEENLPAGYWKVLNLNEHAVVLEAKENNIYPDIEPIIAAKKWFNAEADIANCVSVNAKLLGLLTNGFELVNVFFTGINSPIVVQMGTLHTNMPNGIYIGVIMPMLWHSSVENGLEQMYKDIKICFNLDKKEGESIHGDDE